MPTNIRSQKGKYLDPQPKSSMSHRESNPFEEYANVEEEITEELIQHCQESVTFQNLMKRFIDIDKQNYLLMLNRKQIPMLENFDIEKSRNERIPTTRSRAYTFTQNQEHLRGDDTQNNSHNRDDTHNHDDISEQGDSRHQRSREGNVPLALITQQLQALQQKM